MKIDLLQDIKQSLEDALEKGVPFQQWQKNIRPILQQKGWWGKKTMTNPHTGLPEEVQLGSPRRLSIIYDTNVRMAYAAGHWEALEENKKAAPYLRYVCVMDGKTREEHRRWHNTVLPIDDPFWETHYPPNGWRCRCSVIALSKYDLEKQGLSVTEQPDNGTRGIAAGFDYNVGKDRVRHFSPSYDESLPQTFQNRDDELPPLPTASKLPENAVLPDGLEDTAYMRAFLKEFDAALNTPAVYHDVTDEPLVIGKGLFLDKKTGTYKIGKDNRKKYMKLLAYSIKDPDEIWLQWVQNHLGKWILKRRYIKIYESENGSHCLTVFDKNADSWTGQTTFSPRAEDNISSRDRYIQKYRDGFLAYKKRASR